MKLQNALIVCSPTWCLNLVICPVHDWEGKERESKAKAKMDLEGHKKTYEEETHRGSRVISYER